MSVSQIGKAMTKRKTKDGGQDYKQRLVVEAKGSSETQDQRERELK